MQCQKGIINSSNIVHHKKKSKVYNIESGVILVKGMIDVLRDDNDL